MAFDLGLSLRILLLIPLHENLTLPLSSSHFGHFFLASPGFLFSSSTFFSTSVPHLGHAAALSLISLPHYSHLIKAIINLPWKLAKRHASLITKAESFIYKTTEIYF
jgi:hypothetical protein